MKRKRTLHLIDSLIADTMAGTKTKQQKNTTVYLHDVLITEIMARLPPKSTIRFRCLSKSWAALLTSPFFIKMHLNCGKESKYNDMQRLIFSSGNILHSMSYQTCEKTTSLPIIYDARKDASDGCELLGSCNGLLCLSVSRRTLILWNPSTKEINNLPISFRLDLRDTFGFGYDQSTGDYKIIRFVHARYAENLSKVPIYVYSRKSNTWKRIHPSPPLSYLLENSMSGTFVDGVLYWNVIHSPNIQQSQEAPGVVRRVLGFDLTCDKFEAITPPNDASCNFTLRVIRGCLSLAHNLEGRSIEMWKLEKENKKQSWIKTMTVRNLAMLPESYSLAPICIMENGQVLIADNESVDFFGKGKRPCGFHLYDPAKETFRRINVNGVVQWTRVITYVRSLVSPHLGN